MPVNEAIRAEYYTDLSLHVHSLPLRVTRSGTAMQQQYRSPPYLHEHPLAPPPLRV